MFSYFGSILYVGLLFTNAIAILNEERFLAKSKSLLLLITPHHRFHPRSFQSTEVSALTAPVGWSTRSAASANAGFGHAPNAHMYDQSLGSAGGDPSVKSKLVNLISATRTLMRSEPITDYMDAGRTDKSSTVDRDQCSHVSSGIRSPTTVLTDAVSYMSFY